MYGLVRAFLAIGAGAGGGGAGRLGGTRCVVIAARGGRSGGASMQACKAAGTAGTAGTAGASIEAACVISGDSPACGWEPAAEAGRALENGCCM